MENGRMERQDKGYIIGANVEAKEGERGPLSCNKANARSPSLGFNLNDGDITEDMALDYLASILVEIYLHEQDNGTV